MTRLVVGWGCAGLALGLLVYAVYASAKENSQAAMIALGLALVLLLAAVATLRSTRRPSNHSRL